MALRLCSLALCALLFLVVGATDRAPPRSLQRQIFDTGIRVVRQSPGNAPAAIHTRPQTKPSTETMLRKSPTDVVTLDYPFDTTGIEQLLDNGSIQIPHPEGGLLQVTLRDVRYRHGARILRVQSDGLPGVITQRGERFVGTIATNRATYNLSQHSYQDRGAAQLTDQRQLDLRITPNRDDYRRVPRTAHPREA